MGVRCPPGAKRVTRHSTGLEEESNRREAVASSVDVICPVVSTNSLRARSISASLSSLRLPQPDGRAIIERANERTHSGFALSAISCFNHRLAERGKERNNRLPLRPSASASVRLVQTAEAGRRPTKPDGLLHLKPPRISPLMKVEHQVDSYMSHMSTNKGLCDSRTSSATA